MAMTDVIPCAAAAPAVRKSDARIRAVTELLAAVPQPLKNHGFTYRWRHRSTRATFARPGAGQTQRRFQAAIRCQRALSRSGARRECFPPGCEIQRAGSRDRALVLNGSSEGLFFAAITARAMSAKRYRKACDPGAESVFGLWRPRGRRAATASRSIFDTSPTDFPDLDARGMTQLGEKVEIFIACRANRKEPWPRAIISPPEATRRSLRLMILSDE